MAMIYEPAQSLGGLKTGVAYLAMVDPAIGG